MANYIAKRLFQLVVVLIGVSIITFIILFVVPGDAVTAHAPKGATNATLALIRHNLGLDRPIYVQYGKFVWSLVHGDLGQSFQFNRPVTDMIKEALPNTMQLALAAVLIELLGIPLGVYSALRQFTFRDAAMTTTALVIWGIPVFVMGLILQQVFGLWLGVLPITGAGGTTILGIIPGDLKNLEALILPAFALGILEVAYISYMQRAAMLEVIRSDYVRTARAKGLSERKVVLKHGLKNAMIPVITVAGLDLGSLMGGAILTETVFSRPGLGLMIYTAIGSRDLPVVVGGVLFATVVFVIANLIVDIGYALLDPRIRYE